MKTIVAALLFLAFSEIIQAQTWSAVGSGTDAQVHCSVVYNGEIYVGGEFTTAGGISANHIAKWDGTSWSAVGLGTDNTVIALAIYNNELYVGGYFTTAGGISANHIAKWDGTTWSAVGSGTNNNVLALAIYNNELYVGGYFTTAGGNSANHIAKWNGTTWASVGSGIDGDYVFSLGVFNSELYMGGVFTTAGGISANNIAKWNGTSWSAVGSGTNNSVRAFQVYDGDLYVGGSFTIAGGITVNRIAKWDGTAWSDVGLGFSGAVTSLCEYNSELYATGNFITTVAGVTVNYIAKWDGASWSALGSGFNNWGQALSVYNDDLYAAGNFTTAGGNSANHIAKWSSSCSAPSQPGTITGNTSVCQGSSQTYSIAAVSGATSYTWTLPNGGGWTGSSTTTSITATVGSGGGDISVTADNSCGSSTPQTLAVTVNSAPAQPGAISGSNLVCQGSSQTYSITAVSGATSYSWTPPNGWTGSSTTNSITVTVGSNSGTISVTANNTCGSSPAQSKAVTVISTPAQPGAISGNITVCQGSSQTYSISAVSGATSYTWLLPNGWTGSSNSISITTTAGSNSGSISVTANNTCGNSIEQTLFVTVNTVPVQPGSIIGSNTVCMGSAQTYSISPVSGAISYNWTIPSGWTGSSTSDSITVNVGSSSGSISVTAHNSCGNSIPQSLAVTVNATPAQPDAITGSNAVCQNSSQTYSISSVSGATSYLWTIPNGWTGTSTTNSITLNVGSSGGNISVIAMNSCGSSSAQTFAVIVNPVPAQPGAISGNNSVCQGTSQTYSIDTVSGASGYTWILPTGWTGISNTTSITATTGSNSGNISVTANNSCGSSPAQIFTVTVNSIPAQPDTIIGSIAVCIGGVEVYSINAVSGATNYNWTLPPGWTGTSAFDSIIATVGANAGVISVVATNNCGSSNAQTLAILVSTVPPQPGAISGENSVCQGSVQTYSISPVNNTTGYTWILPPGWSGVSSTTSITATVGASAGTISVTAENSCGSSIPQILIVDNSAPEQPGNISGSDAVCAGTSQTYTIDPVAGAASYTWTLPGGWAGSSTTTSITAIAGDTSGNISVTSNNICGSSTPQTLPVTVTLIPTQPDAITGNTTVEVGQEFTYSINDVPGATGYNWSLSGGGSITSGQSTTSVTVNWQAAGNDTLSVNAINECGTGIDQTLPITVSMVSALIEPGDPFGIKVMPNPFDEEVYLTATGVMNKEIDIQILNLAGQFIYRNQLRAETNDFTQLINIHDVPAGLYEVKILIGKKLFIRTISRLD